MQSYEITWSVPVFRDDHVLWVDEAQFMNLLCFADPPWERMTWDELTREAALWDPAQNQPPHDEEEDGEDVLSLEIKEMYLVARIPFERIDDVLPEWDHKPLATHKQTLFMYHIIHPFMRRSKRDVCLVDRKEAATFMAALRTCGNVIFYKKNDKLCT